MRIRLVELEVPGRRMWAVYRRFSLWAIFKTFEWWEIVSPPSHSGIFYSYSEAQEHYHKLIQKDTKRTKKTIKEYDTNSGEVYSTEHGPELHEGTGKFFKDK